MPNEFVMTIEDDADVPSEHEESESEMNSGFSFAVDHGEIERYTRKGQSSWDFDGIKQLMGGKKRFGTSVDEKIAALKEGTGDAADMLEDDDECDEEVEKSLEVNAGGADDDGVPDDEDRVQEKRKAEFFASEDEKEEEGFDTFHQMNMSRPLMRGLNDMGYVKPTRIQCMTIPIALMGKDICGAASTGSGKTAAFLLPILERLLYRPRQLAAVRVLILTPTRELAAQCHSVAVQLAKYTDIVFSLCVGGMSNQQQEQELKKRPDVLIATPGRLIDHIKNSANFGLDQVDILVMDEADRMLEEGFQAEIKEIVGECPRNRQTLLFSATMTDDVDQLIKLSMNKPVRLFLDPTKSVASNLVQEFIRVRVPQNATVESEKVTVGMTVMEPKEVAVRESILISLCSRTYKSRAIIFFPSKALCHRMKIVFGLAGLTAAELHGNLTQLQRLESLEKFRDGQVDFLLATDLAARGLDIAGVETVINFCMPTQYEKYVHRVGRTARNERSGKAVTLIGENERKMLKVVVKNLRPGQQLKQRTIPTAVLKKYSLKLQELEDDVKKIRGEEKEERAMRQAEMEITKAQNMIDHADEIYSRPAKVWFQSEKERKEARKPQEKKEEEDEIQRLIKIKRGPLDGLSRKQKRRKMMEKESGGKENMQKEQKKQKLIARQVKKHKDAPVKQDAKKKNKKQNFKRAFSK